MEDYNFFLKNAVFKSMRFDMNDMIHEKYVFGIIN